MMKKGVIAFAVFLGISVLIISSCAQQFLPKGRQAPPKTAKEIYLEDVGMARMLKEYKIVYSMDFASLKAQLGNGEIKAGLFRKNGNEKSVVEMNFAGQTITGYLYTIDAEMYQCAKGSVSAAASTEEAPIECIKTNPSEREEISKFTHFASDVSHLDFSVDAISQSGRKDILGRKCDAFNIRLKSLSTITDLMGRNSPISIGKSFEGTPGEMEICLDRMNGTVMALALNAVIKSELDGKETSSQILNIVATSYEEKVSDTEYTLPVKYLVSINACDKNEVVTVIEPTMDFSGDIVVNRFEYKKPFTGEKVPVKIRSQERSLKKGSTQVISVNTEGKLADVYQFCLGDDCKTLSCNTLESPKCLKWSGNRESCVADSDCVYFEPICERFDCMKIQKEAACGSNQKCAWRQPSSPYENGSCSSKACTDFKDINECASSNLGCEWSEFSHGCTKKFCSTIKTLEECSSSPLKCDWSGKRCVDYSCFNITTEEQCTGSGKCAWTQDNLGTLFCKRDIEG